MKIVSYRTQGPWRAGILEETSLLDIATSTPAAFEAFGSVRALLAAGPGAVVEVLQHAQRAFEAGKAPLLALESVELGPPIPDPEKIICLGLNYADHALETNMEQPEIPLFFAKYANALGGPTSSIVLPRVSQQIDYEGELAVVMGRRCKEVTEQDALAYVAGYTIMNDVSARDLQFRTSQWMVGKVLDTFAPMGPGIVPAADIPDPQQLTITTRVNGKTLQQGNTAHMIFSVAQTIAFLSSILTLEPGDIIATGTPPGVGFKRKPPIFLQAGDVVEVEIERIGAIRNRVVVPDARSQ